MAKNGKIQKFVEVIDVRDLYKWSCAAVLWLMTSMAVSAETLTAGMSGSAVADLQNALVQAGYLARTVDGDYGSTTKEAVFLFQKDHGLPATGKADDATIASIRRNENSGYRNGGNKNRQTQLYRISKITCPNTFRPVVSPKIFFCI